MAYGSEGFGMPVGPMAFGAPSCGCGLGSTYGCALHGPGYGDAAARWQRRLIRLDGRTWGRWRESRKAKIQAKMAAKAATGQAAGMSAAQLEATAAQEVAAQEGYLPPTDVAVAADATGALPGGPLPWVIGGVAVLGLIAWATTGSSSGSGHAKVRTNGWKRKNHRNGRKGKRKHARRSRR